MVKRSSLPDDFTDAKLAKVIELLESDSPISKKAACEMLNITYNTTRLAKLIEQYKNRKETEKRLRKQNLRKPLEESDLVYIAQEYLNGGSILGISEKLYRTPYTVKSALKSLKIPIKSEIGNSTIIDESAQADDYTKDSLVYSAIYNCPAMVEAVYKDDRYYGNVYRLWLLGEYQCFAHQPWFELADLREIQKILKSSIKADQGIPPSNLKR